jgi:hypothetical protein
MIEFFFGTLIVIRGVLSEIFINHLWKKLAYEIQRYCPVSEMWIQIQ